MHHRRAPRTTITALPLMLLIAGSAVLGAARCADAAETVVMVANLTEIKKPNAFIDVTVDTQANAGSPIDVEFTVFDSYGGTAASFVVTADANGFASSASAVPPNDNLFTATGGGPALVRIKTPPNIGVVTATLHQKFQQSQLVLGVPPTRKSDGSPLGMGRVFAVNPGAIRHRATLLIANVSSADLGIDVFLGTRGATNNGVYNNQLLSANTFWIVDIDPAYANTNLVVVSSDYVVAQLVVDEGKKNALTGVTLVPAAN